MLTAAAEAGVVELSRLAVRLTCSSHISSEQLGARFRRRGVEAAEKMSEVTFGARRGADPRQQFFAADRLSAPRKISA